MLWASTDVGENGVCTGVVVEAVIMPLLKSAKKEEEVRLILLLKGVRLGNRDLPSEQYLNLSLTKGFTKLPKSYRHRLEEINYEAIFRLN